MLTDGGDEKPELTLDSRSFGLGHTFLNFAKWRSGDEGAQEERAVKSRACRVMFEDARYGEVAPGEDPEGVSLVVQQRAFMPEQRDYR